MNLFIYRLHFNGPVRFGVTGIGLEETDLTLAADGLTSAFLNALAEKEGAPAVESFITESQAGHPPAVFSALFPFGPDPLNPSHPIMALPRPLSAPPVAPETGREWGKKLKKLRWLRPLYAAAWLRTEVLTEKELEEIYEGSKELAASKKSPEDKVGWYMEELRPRVALDRATSGSALWACAAIRFIPEAGLYGLVRIRDDWQSRWLETMRLLGEMGIGGERTYGFGEFSLTGLQPLGPEWQPLISLNSGRYFLLSTYYPASHEKALLAEALEAWEVVERRGYVVTGRYTSTIKRKRLRLLVPGSVLRFPLKGTYADVTPDNHLALGLSHRVYRAGLALTLPVG